MKFQRSFSLQVQDKNGELRTFTDPLTVVFDVNRRATGSLNTGHFMLYGLSPQTRRDIEYDNAIDGAPRKFTFRAGYVSEGYKPIIYQGTLQRAFSYRDDVEVVTEMQVLDGGIAVQQAQYENTFNLPWKPSDAAKAIIATMGPHGVTLGAVGSLFNKYQAQRGVTFIGAAWDHLLDLASASGGYACIDLEKAYLMAQNDVIAVPGSIPQIDATTGLLGTPRRTAHIVDAEMIFEPRVQLLQQIKLVSAITPSLNGTYSIQALSHRGIISGAKDGGVVTALSLFDSPIGFNVVTP